jgi:hypothetical protein
MNPGVPLSNMTLTKVLRDMGLAGQATAHGMRSTLKVWCAEVAKVRDEVSEVALTQMIPGLAERKPLTVAWARLCDEARPAGTVVSLTRATS